MPLMVIDSLCYL